MASPFAEYGYAPYDELTPRPAGPGAKPPLLTRPFSAWELLKGAGKGALNVLKSRPLGTAAAVLPAAGALASKMAGGSALEGAVRPDLLTNALGEGYARYAPTWAGGLSDASVKAGDSQGASDIDGRFGARPASPNVIANPRPAVSPTYRSAGPWTSGYGLPGGGDVPPGLASPFPPVSPFSAEDIRGNRVPVSSTGAFMNSRGEVTNLDTRSIPGPAPLSAEGLAAQYAPTQYRERIPDAARTPAARFFGASMGLKRIAGDETRKMAEKEIGVKRAIAAATVGVTERESMRKATADESKSIVDWVRAQAGATKDLAEAGVLNTRLAVVQEAVKSGKYSLADLAVMAAGRAPVGDRFQSPPNMQPMPGSKDANTGVVFNASTGTYTNVPITRTITEANIAGWLNDNKGKSRKDAIAAYKARGMELAPGPGAVRSRGGIVNEEDAARWGAMYPNGTFPR